MANMLMANGNVLRVGDGGSFTGVTTDNTLSGNGTISSPLGVTEIPNDSGWVSGELHKPWGSIIDISELPETQDQQFRIFDFSAHTFGTFICNGFGTNEGNTASYSAFSADSLDALVYECTGGRSENHLSSFPNGSAFIRGNQHQKFYPINYINGVKTVDDSWELLTDGTIQTYTDRISLVHLPSGARPDLYVGSIHVEGSGTHSYIGASASCDTLYCLDLNADRNINCSYNINCSDNINCSGNISADTIKGKDIWISEEISTTSYSAVDGVTWENVPQNTDTELVFTAGYDKVKFVSPDPDTTFTASVRGIMATLTAESVLSGWEQVALVSKPMTLPGYNATAKYITNGTDLPTIDLYATTTIVNKSLQKITDLNTFYSAFTAYTASHP